MAKRDASPNNANQIDRSAYSPLSPATNAGSESIPNNALSAGTRVFKKSSPNSKITAYLGKRDFVDQITHTEPIDGVILVDPEYVTGTLKVYASVLAAFRYGREDLDVLGLTFRKDLYLAVAQVYPPVPKETKPLTRLQERLIKKLGHNAYPFNFELPTMAPASVILQPAPNDTGKPCGVDYELKCFVSESLEDKPLKKSTVRLAIRKVMYAPEDAGPQPHVEVSRDFIMSPGPLHMEVTLDKKKYYHGEPISINVQIANNSNKTVKKIRISVRQHADICLFSTAQYKCTVAELESDDGFPLGPCCNLSKVYYLTPLLRDNRDKRGLALDGKLKHEDTNLASSTIFREERTKTGSSHTSHESSPLHPDNKAIAEDTHHHDNNGKDAHKIKEKESLGIIVRYTVKVKLIVAFGQDVSAEVEFILTHPKPEPQEEPTAETGNSETIDKAPILRDSPATPVANLIELGDSSNSPIENKSKMSSYDNLGMTTTTNAQRTGEEDIIFEDFARLRLAGGDRDEFDSTPTPHQPIT